MPRDPEDAYPDGAWFHSYERYRQLARSAFSKITDRHWTKEELAADPAPVELKDPAIKYRPKKAPEPEGA